MGHMGSAAPTGAGVSDTDTPLHTVAAASTDAVTETAPPPPTRPKRPLPRPSVAPELKQSAGQPQPELTDTLQATPRQEQLYSIAGSALVDTRDDTVAVARRAARDQAAAERLTRMSSQGRHDGTSDAATMQTGHTDLPPESGPPVPEQSPLPQSVSSTDAGDKQPEGDPDIIREVKEAARASGVSLDSSQSDTESSSSSSDSSSEARQHAIRTCDVSCKLCFFVLCTL